MIKVHQTNFMPGILTSINKNFGNNIFMMIMYVIMKITKLLYYENLELYGNLLC